MSRNLTTIFLLGTLAAALGLTSAGPVQADPNGPVITARVLPVQMDALANSEPVHFTGLLFVLVQAWPAAKIIPTDPCRIDMFLYAQATSPTGKHYQAVGGSSFVYLKPPPNDYEGTAFFPIAPVDPCRCSLPLHLNAHVDASGHAGNVSVSTGNVLGGRG